MAGYVNLYRDIEQHWIWQHPRQLQWWLTLIFMASWKERVVTWGKTSVTLKEGQIITSIRYLMKRCGVSSHTIDAFLKALESDGMIKREATPKYTLITIVNYAKYQVNQPQQSVVPKREVLREMQQKEEVKTEEKKEITTTAVFSREKEEKFFEELQGSEIFWEQFPISQKESVDELRELSKKFHAFCLSQQKAHQDAADYRCHFVNWLAKRPREEEGPAKKQNSKYGTTNQNQRGSALRPDPRRGSEVTATSRKDYEKSF